MWYKRAILIARYIHTRMHILYTCIHACIYATPTIVTIWNIYEVLQQLKLLDIYSVSSHWNSTHYVLFLYFYFKISFFYNSSNLLCHIYKFLTGEMWGANFPGTKWWGLIVCIPSLLVRMFLYPSTTESAFPYPFA